MAPSAARGGQSWPRHVRAAAVRARRGVSVRLEFDAYNHVPAALGGVPQRDIYANMKTAVDRVGRGKSRVVNAGFKVMVSHFLFEADFCTPGAGWEKGQIEKNVRTPARESGTTHRGLATSRH